MVKKLIEYLKFLLIAKFGYESNVESNDWSCGV